MALPKFMQDALNHFRQTKGVHGSTPTPKKDSLVQAGADGKIDAGWMPSTVVQTNSGKISGSVLPATIKSGGNTTTTGFQLANGTDLAAVFGKLMGVENATSGSGDFLSGVSLSVNGTKVKMTQTKRGPAYCTYCTHCSHCAYGYYCSYCTYCTYCHCDCSCNG